MSLGQFANLVDVPLVNALLRIRKTLADERLPVFLGNRPERITLGDRLPKNFFAVSNTLSIDVLMDSVIDLATVVMKVVSPSVGHKSTYART